MRLMETVCAAAGFADQRCRNGSGSIGCSNDMLWMRCGSGGHRLSKVEGAVGLLGWCGVGW